jgi:sialic acid synthase SpsE
VTAAFRVGPIDVSERVLVVAEIGNNHEGDVGAARELVEAAAEAGVHAVKFQTFRTELFVAPSNEARFAQMKRFELSYDDFASLADLARSRGLLFMSTPLDLDSAAFLEAIADGIKIASGDNDFYPLIERVAAGDKPLIISLGISGVDQAERTVAAVERVRGTGDDARLALLHCTSAYPTPPHDVNLLAIPRLAEEFGYAIGYSDHAMGLDAALGAVALGARIVEKHFTFEHVESDFRDHALSATPSQMAELVRLVEEIGAMRGDGVKQVRPAEEPLAEAIRRSVAARRELSAGEVVQADDLMWIRPGGGIAPGDEELVIGRRLVRDVATGDLLATTDVDGG